MTKTTKKISALVLSVSIIIFIILSLLCLSACDSSGGRSNIVTIDSYRGNYQFQLPINVSKKTNPPDGIKYFKSKESLTEICVNINEDGKYTATEYDGYILIHHEEHGYCIIAPSEKDKYNYLITNMAFLANTVEGKELYKQILVPLHMLDVSFDSGTIIEGVEYIFSATKEDLKNFYIEYGFQVEETNDSLVVTDPTGRFYGDMTSFDDVVEQFEIRLDDNKITFYFVNQ